ncbi:MAG: hypothetical protein AVDCRST_MAG30-2401 [uncultured Solirubrobacteraceae bacterium]|uniref:HTH iclR-type domain-containing protein n=1 Tax=uncultured Solirubrobacteraceae bacterium TaxID=1162706 RepID=A0A6J4SZJ9_9ACTN|nr:MAG: hypothetical protein AVDCRST_MAG30-2401 [uncultured Solirubrobacteraceae bacterium]
MVAFIAANLESVAQLEVLLLLRAAPGKRWTVDEVARAQVSAPDSIARCLEYLAGRGLLDADEDGDGFRYAPPAAQEPVVDQLAKAYATRRPTVVAQIFAPPAPGAASTLAEGFRFRRRD